VNHFDALCGQIVELSFELVVDIAITVLEISLY